MLSALSPAASTMPSAAAAISSVVNRARIQLDLSLFARPHTTRPFALRASAHRGLSLFARALIAAFRSSRERSSPLTSTAYVKQSSEYVHRTYEGGAPCQRPSRPSGSISSAAAPDARRG